MKDDVARSSEETRGRLAEIRRALLRLHKTLLEAERAAYERSRGRVASGGEFLQLVIKDPWFSWLRPVSELIVRIDELTADEEGLAGEGAEDAVAQARLLLRPPGEAGGEFGRRYYRALQQSPDVVLAHAALARLLNAGPPPREMSEAEIDESLEETFPASDPPPWTLGTNHADGE
jgi:hypothetical protein